MREKAFTFLDGIKALFLGEMVGLSINTLNVYFVQILGHFYGAHLAAEGEWLYSNYTIFMRLN
jgi:hypothetical protein